MNNLNNSLEIKKLEGLKFGNIIAYVKPVGYAFYHKDFGFLSFKSTNQKLAYGVKVPYIPMGGKKALENIISEGGFTHFDDIEWIKPII